MEMLTDLTLQLTFLDINETRLIKLGNSERAAFQRGMKRCRLPAA